MPLYVPAEESQPGMHLAESFMFMGRIMLPAGRVLSQSDVAKLRQRFVGVYLRIGDPLLDQAVEFEDDSHERNVAHHVQAKITQCMSSVEERFSSRASLGGAVFEEAKTVVEEMTAYLADNPVTAALLDQHFDGSNYLSRRAGNVFYLSMVLASAVRPYVISERSRQNISSAVATNLLPLGLGAMFIDLGMHPLADLLEKDAELTPEQQKLIRQHPVAGVDMLPERFPGTAKMVVRTHHENFNGKGYPDGIDGDKLHVFSRIVRIADAYDAATSKHVYKDAKSPACALWAMANGPYKQYYDPVIMKTFATLIQPFPIGAKLRLEDGRHAVVVKYNRTNPFEPVAIVAFDANDQRLPDSELLGPVTLGDSSGLRIGSFRGEDHSFIYERPGQSPNPRASLADGQPCEHSGLFDLAFP